VAPLVGLAGRTAGEAVVASLRSRRGGERDGVEFHTRMAQLYAERLGRSRGVLMKAGQILSMVLPESGVDGEYRGIYQAAFAKLQDDAPPMPAELAIEVVTAELGRPPSALFAEFDPDPLAAASIGQVHRATLRDGRPVVVKVQYPGVDEAIRADLKNTELLSTFLRLLFSVMPNTSSLDLPAMAREVSARIGEEIDYRAEAANQQEFADLYRGHPFIRIPEVIPELSARRVLTSDYVEGLRFAKAARAEQHLRDRWGEAVQRFVYDSIYRHGLYNADPHPGNYLFHSDGTVTFLDFGCVKRLAPDDARRLSGCLPLIVTRDAEGLRRWAVDAGFVNPADEPDADELLAYWINTWRHLMPPQPLTITPEFVASVTRAQMSPFGPHKRVVSKFTMRGSDTMAARVVSGSTMVLGALRATGSWMAMIREYTESAPPSTAYGELEAAFRAGHR
jgi:predicted unusual protein kinase regulating ubiquinone biosynthesis (AarF/ABC1/UbiB family)